MVMMFQFGCMSSAPKVPIARFMAKSSLSMEIASERIASNVHNGRFLMRSKAQGRFTAVGLEFLRIWSASSKSCS